jgi:glutathione S-transferase
MTSRIGQLGKQLFTMAQKIKTDITLYTTNTPNGIKASILLEELNLDYKASPYNLPH